MKKQRKVLSLLLGMSVFAGAITGCGGSRVYEATSSDTYTEAAYETAEYEYYTVPENTESYEKPDENGFFVTQVQPLSTFAADVDTASYANIRRMIESKYSLSDINADAVRPEEFINYFNYDLNSPEGNDKFGVTTEIAPCPWNDDHKLMFVGVKAQELESDEEIVNNLVFLIDVSGSMFDDDKLPLLQKAFTELVKNLPDEGTVSIVTYAGDDRVILEGESLANKDTIIRAINNLEAGGSTNGEAGIKKAYQIAEANFVKGGNNRVIIASDGDMNVGISSPDDLEKLIEEKKESGVFLSVLGFGTGNYKDDRMERLADCGNGNYSYIDSMLEAKKVLVEEMNSTLYTVAKDAKFQVEFNPSKINAYRLIGYENRIMDATDFNDDTKDGGEIGSGHTVIALYEIIEDGAESAVELKYQNNDESEKKDDSQYADEFATVNIRYKEPDADTSELISVVVNDEAVSEEPSENLKFAGMVAEFAMILSDSEHKGNSSFEYIMDTYKTLENKDEYKEEFNQLVRMVSKNS